MSERAAIEFVTTELASGALFASLARNYASTGHTRLFAESLEHAQNALEQAGRTFAILTNITEEDRRSIEDKIAALTRALERLSVSG